MQELLTKLIPNVMDRLPTFFEAIGDTLLMVVWSGAISFVLGLALGVLITVTKPGEEPITTNMKVLQSDLDLLDELKNLAQ